MVSNQFVIYPKLAWLISIADAIIRNSVVVHSRTELTSNTDIALPTQCTSNAPPTRQGCGIQRRTRTWVSALSCALSSLRSRKCGGCVLLLFVCVCVAYVLVVWRWCSASCQDLALARPPIRPSTHPPLHPSNPPSTHPSIHPAERTWMPMSSPPSSAPRQLLRQVTLSGNW